MVERCYLYHRTSAAHTDDRGLDRLREAAASRRWSVIGEHADEQERPSDERPAFDELAGALRLGPTPVGLVALSLERLFPSRFPGAIRRLARWLKLGVRIVVLEAGIDTAMPATWTDVIEPLAVMSTRQRSEATAAGHALRTRAGLVERNAWNDPEIRRRFRAGESQRVMARALHVAQSSLCLRLRELRAEGYIGERDEKAREAAQKENPPHRGGRPKKADPAPAQSP